MFLGGPLVLKNHGLDRISTPVTFFFFFFFKVYKLRKKREEVFKANKSKLATVGETLLFGRGAKGRYYIAVDSASSSVLSS